MIEINYTFNSHAHLQTLTKTPAKFQEYPAKIVGEIAFTRYPMTICFGRSRAKILLCSNCEKIINFYLMIKAKRLTHFKTLPKHLQSFQEIWFKL